MSVLEGFGFHESEVISFCYQSDLFVLLLKGVLVDGNESSVEIRVTTPTRVTVDGELCSGDLMRYEHGEVLSLDMDGNTLSIIVEWHRFSPRATETLAYEVIDGTISLRHL